jgi:hypothetical protein
MRMPVSDEKTLYVETFCMTSIKEVIERIQDHFGVESVDFEEFTISAEHIQVDCFGYDLYDRGDYEDFIVITRKMK